MNNSEQKWIRHFEIKAGLNLIRFDDVMRSCDLRGRDYVVEPQTFLWYQNYSFNQHHCLMIIMMKMLSFSPVHLTHKKWQWMRIQIKSCKRDQSPSKIVTKFVANNRSYFWRKQFLIYLALGSCGCWTSLCYLSDDF